MPFKSQKDCNPNDPEEFALWAVLGVMVRAETPMLQSELTGRAFSKGLWEFGFHHIDQLRALADEDGNINVSQLRPQQFKVLRPYRGQQHWANGSIRVVPMDEPEPEPIRIQDLRAMTVHEQQAVVAQADALGLATPVVKEANAPTGPTSLAEIKALAEEERKRYRGEA